MPDIESTTGTFWLYGTAVEHHTLYQYQLANTKDIFMGQIQTETPYVHPSPSPVHYTGLVKRLTLDAGTTSRIQQLPRRSLWSLL